MIYFTLDDLDCELSLNNHSAYQSSVLLRDYMSLDPRVHTLATAVRYWAKLCHIDRQAEGTLPGHCFSVMLIFFLQQERFPVLPCLHDGFDKKDIDAYESKLMLSIEFRCDLQ